VLFADLEEEALEMDQNKPNRQDEQLDDAMERDTEIRRDTQVRGSLGIPPSGRDAARESSDRDEAVPEFDRGGDEDQGSQR
jgi:hypothetical protein